MARRTRRIVAAVAAVAATAPLSLAQSAPRLTLPPPAVPDLAAVVFQPDPAAPPPTDPLPPSLGQQPIPPPRPAPTPPASLGQQPLLLPPVPNPTPSQTNTNQLNQLFELETTPDICAQGEGYLTADFRYLKFPGDHRQYRYQLQGQYGITDHLAAGAYVPGITLDDAAGTHTGFGDVVLYGQYKLDQVVNPDVVDLTAQVDVVLPTGDRPSGRDTGHFGVRPLLLAYKDFGRQGPGDLGLYGLLGFTITTDADVRLGVAATYQVDRLVAVLELTDETGIHHGPPPVRPHPRPRLPRPRPPRPLRRRPPRPHQQLAQMGGHLQGDVCVREVTGLGTRGWGLVTAANP